MSPCSIASTYLLWFGERGCTIRFTPADRCLPESTSDFSVVAGSAITSFSIPFSSPFCSVTPTCADSRSRQRFAPPAPHFNRTGDLDLVRSEIDRYLKTVFHKPKVLIAGPVQGLNTRRDLKGFFYQAVF